jgi:hypothetical protein
MAAAGSLLSERQGDEYLYERLVSLSLYQDTLKKVPQKCWGRSTKLRSVTFQKTAVFIYMFFPIDISFPSAIFSVLVLRLVSFC